MLLAANNYEITVLWFNSTAVKLDGMEKFAAIHYPVDAISDNLKKPLACSRIIRMGGYRHHNLLVTGSAFAPNTSGYFANYRQTYYWLLRR